MFKSLTVETIPKDVNYEGYLWMSDQTEPETDLLHTKLEGITDLSNPFIVEGQLYSEKEQKSYSIKYTDGKHIVIEYNLKTTLGDNTKVTEKKYIANRIDGVSKLKFRQYWEPKTDELCEGMNVLIPTAFVFVGFESENNKGGQ